MRCVLSGANGHLGSTLAHELHRRGHDLLLLMRPGGDRRRLAGLPDSIAIRDLDLAAPIRQDLLSGFQPEVFFHLAWQGVAGAARNRPEQITVNVPAALALQEAAAAAGCQTWIGLGSQAEYAPANAAIDENHPTQPRSAYGQAKLAVGQLGACLARWQPMRFVWVRLFATYGPGDLPTALIPRLIQAALRGEVLPLTPGEQVWDYLYVRDAAEALIALAESPRAEGVFNLASGQAIPIHTLASSIRDLIDPQLPLGLGQIPYGPDQIMHLQGRVDKLRDKSGWSPRTEWTDGLRQTVDWYRHQGIREPR